MLTMLAKPVGKHTHMPLGQIDFLSPSNSHSLVNALPAMSAMQAGLGLQEAPALVSLTAAARAAYSIQSFPWSCH